MDDAHVEESMPNSDIERIVERAVASALLVQRAAAPSPPPDSARAWMPVVTGIVGAAGILIGGINWMSTLGTKVDVVVGQVAEVRESQRSLESKMSDLADNRWTRDDQERFNEKVIQPLEARIRELEQQAEKSRR